MNKKLSLVFIIAFLFIIGSSALLLAQDPDRELGLLESVYYVDLDDNTLLDFTQWNELIRNEEFSTYPPEDPVRDVPYGELSEDMLDDDLQPLYRVTSEDMRLSNWVVELNHSAQSVENMVNSYTREVTRGGSATRPANGAGDMVLGIRIHFPTHQHNAWARIRPPFEITAYKPDGSMANVRNGVINNVGMIKWLTLKVAGRNYRESIAIRLLDENDNVTEYFMGHLFFNGWRILRWDNPNYYVSNSYANLVRMPLYPQRVPIMKFDSLIIYRDGDVLGGDFITYISDIQVDYVLAIPMESVTDIDDEMVWGIFREEQQEKGEETRKRLADYIEIWRHSEALREASGINGEEDQ